MKCETSKEELIGYFYDELPGDEKKKVTAHVNACPTCKNELKNLRQATRLLRAWPEEEPNIDHTLIREKTRAPERWHRKSLAGKLVFGFATATAAALIILSLVNLEINYADGNLDLRMSLLPRSEVSTDLPENLVTGEELAKLREEAYDYTKVLLEDSEARQRSQQKILLTDFAKEIEKQRQQDLRFVGRGLDAFQLANETRFYETTEVLNQLIQASYVQSMQNPPGEKE